MLKDTEVLGALCAVLMGGYATAVRYCWLEEILQNS